MQDSIDSVKLEFANVDEVSQHHFSDSEIAGLLQIPTKKHYEHLAGILATRRVISREYPHRKNIALHRNKNAPPTVIVDGKILKCNISVSHSGGIAIAGYYPGDELMGVDIQSTQQFTLPPEDFLSPQEILTYLRDKI